VLRDAQLEGANLRMAMLHGADMMGAKLQGSDLAGAHVWRTTPPGAEVAAYSDMAQVIMRPPSEEELAALAASLAQIEDGRLKARLADTVLGLTDAGQNAGWATSSDPQVWQGLARSSSDAAAAEGYKSRLTDYLARLMCRPRQASGAVAAGIARRAMVPGFKGDMPALYDKLRSPDCPASAAMSPLLMRDLATAVDAARGQ
jgi:hypothetical protein